MLQGEHSAILSTFIQLPFVINIFILSIFGVAVLHMLFVLIVPRLLEVEVLYKYFTFHGA